MNFLNSRGLYISFVLFSILLGCSQSDSGSANSFTAYPKAILGNTPTGINVVPISVGCGYINEPCVSVTICEPGTNNCQTIDNVLLDTGSYGLRLFHQTISRTLTQETDSSGDGYAECISYADGSSQWGPVVTADIVLGSVKASSVPMQIVNADYATAPADCTDLDTSPAADGYNGILGVGLFAQDCGSNCVVSSAPDVYYICDGGGTCSPSAISLSAQVTNPIAMMPSDYNNGAILELPDVGDGGAVGADGVLILGIGSVANNTPSTTPTIYSASTLGYFKTTFEGHTYNRAFIDSGSNGNYFPSSALPTCGTLNSFYCPSSLTALTAVQKANSGLAQQNIDFNVLSADISGNSSNPNMVFNNLAGYMSGAFDWGLPFFLGRTIYLGFDGKTGFGSTGPFWAY